MMKLPTLLICLLLSFVFAFAQKAEPQQPASQQGDGEVNAEQVTDDTIELMRQDIRSQWKQIVAANLPLTEPESIKFWGVYDRKLSSEIPLANRDFGPQISRAARLRKTQNFQTHKESVRRAACCQNKSTKASNL